MKNATPGIKLLLAILIGLALAVPLFAIYLLVYDRQSQSETARTSIAAGWGGPQTFAGPVLVIPYPVQGTETVQQNGQEVTRSTTNWRELTLAPLAADLHADLAPERRHRSIYEAVVYQAQLRGAVRFALPTDLARFGVTADQLAFDRAELRFGLQDARGLFGPPPSVMVDGHPLVLQPGKGPAETGGSGFFAWLNGATLRQQPMTVRFHFAFRGNGWLALAPQAGDTRWTVTSPWPHPSFVGGFLPASSQVRGDGFTATYRVGNLALGRALLSSSDEAAPPTASADVSVERDAAALTQAPGDFQARVDLIQPIDLYAQVNRAVKYGFLFIGFTFMAFLMFDLIAGVRVGAIEYLLVGVGLVLFFVLLLAFAEVVGFLLAYLIAALAIIGLLSSYSAAILGSWRRGQIVAGLLAGLYGVLYILLNLEAYSLLIGSVLLFAALAAVMYTTRRIDWGRRSAPVPAPAPVGAPPPPVPVGG